MVARMLDVPEKTDAAIRDLADITDVRTNDPFSRVVFDALRVYEWVLLQQAQGKVIATLTPDDMRLLEQSVQVSGDRDFLASFIPDTKRDEAYRYLQIARKQVGRGR